MISKETLQQVMVSNQADIERHQVMLRTLPGDDFACHVLVGVRRAGKSYMLYQKIQQLLCDGHTWAEMLYLNFEDDRLTQFSVQDFDLILEAHAQLYGQRPWLFLDEVQNIVGWEKFARRLADSKYRVWITGSNAHMLSSEIMTTLGGRYLTTEVYPYSLSEYLQAIHVAYDPQAMLGTESRAALVRACDNYINWGGLPESIPLTVKRDYLSSTLQKIYLSDIASRGKISNSLLLRLLIKKLAESICQPVSYNRLSHLLSSVSGKISMPTVSKYIENAEAAWLLLRLRNVSAPFAEKETSCKYYFVDNGLVSLFLMDGRAQLLENLVALALFRRYGHDATNERVFFYNDKVEVDFYIPETETAIQVSHSITQSDDTRQREVNALSRLPSILPCRERLILTRDETDTIHDSHGIICVMPAWLWILK